MKVDICSLDMGFIQSCRSVLEIWSAFVCVDLDLSPAALWENLPEGEQTKSRILFLDAESWTLDEDLKLLEKVRAFYGAVFVCARDSRKAIALYRLRPTAFLSRPMSASALDRAMSQCVSLWQAGVKNLELTENRSRMKVPMCDILWAEAQGRNCVLHGLSRDLQIGASMNELTTQLPGDVFIRCQRSYLVNLRHVRQADGKFVYMTNGEAISIGRSTRPEVMSVVEHYQLLWNEQQG